MIDDTRMLIYGGRGPDGKVCYLLLNLKYCFSNSIEQSTARHVECSIIEAVMQAQCIL